uniref:Uncharacterized protein n=1 Tax=Romanomermis culicivorax TaxID=13658 RepID=A0A915IEL5_ROMCU
MDEYFVIFGSLCNYKDFNMSYFHLNFDFDRLISKEKSMAPKFSVSESNLVSKLLANSENSSASKRTKI